MIEERLTDEERALIANLLVAACPEDGVHPTIISILRKISGCDTVVIAHRAYPSVLAEVSRDPRV